MAIDDKKDAPPADLRDVLVIWLFATANSETLEKIIAGTMSNKDLETELVNKGFIRDKNKNNQNTCEDVVANIQAANQTFRDVRSALTGMRVFTGSWGGSPQHPRDAELNNVLNVTHPPA